MAFDCIRHGEGLTDMALEMFRKWDCGNNQLAGEDIFSSKVLKVGAFLGEMRECLLESLKECVICGRETTNMIPVREKEKDGVHKEPCCEHCEDNLFSNY